MCGRRFRNGDDCFGSGVDSRYPPPWCPIGIIGLGRNRQIIYWPQPLAGKILVSNNLAAGTVGSYSQNGTMRARPTVSASAMIADLELYAQGQMSQGSVEKSFVEPMKQPRIRLAIRASPDSFRMGLRSAAKCDHWGYKARVISLPLRGPQRAALPRCACGWGESYCHRGFAWAGLKVVGADSQAFLFANL